MFKHKGSKKGCAAGLKAQRMNTIGVCSGYECSEYECLNTKAQKRDVQRSNFSQTLVI